MDIQMNVQNGQGQNGQGQQGEAPGEPKVLTTLQITFDSTGSVQAFGPLNNKLLCYGLLESARDIVSNYHAKLLAQQKVAPQEGPNPLNPLGF